MVTGGLEPGLPSLVESWVLSVRVRVQVWVLSNPSPRQDQDHEVEVSRPVWRSRLDWSTTTLKFILPLMKMWLLILIFFLPHFIINQQIQQLNTLINMLIGKLSKGDRQKIMTICTIDVHARDVVAALVLKKIDSALAFQWLSQLRHRWDEEKGDCFANICDAQFRYSYEYLGNTPRLVITPLTDR